MEWKKAILNINHKKQGRKIFKGGSKQEWIMVIYDGIED